MKREPVAIIGIVVAVLLVVADVLNAISDELAGGADLWTVLSVGLVGLGAAITRRLVTPVADPRTNEGTPLH